MENEYMHLINKVHEIVITNTPQRIAEHGYIVNVQTAKFVLASYVTLAERKKLGFRMRLQETKTFRTAVNDLIKRYNKDKYVRILVNNIIGTIDGVEA